jgi:hypothetical protein
MHLVKYVDWENVHAAERQKHVEIVTVGARSDERPPMRRSRSNNEEEGHPTGTWARRSETEEEEAPRRDKEKQQATMETEDKVMVTTAGLAASKEIKRVRTPKARGHIRMMFAQKEIDVLAQFREMRVEKLK